ncbi:hypothetical protein AJ78_02307 [Emergomyces pasteurianus Ep9510]|uniref:Uncharacterized protein n=1 Tax=Emergomyces pasteurianus Ep9510 TaxID=1447872 RepID=A0A1J9PM75_9EURO|nr:hypothetical protein AJ78_02307 [Emergomyces pasteurianus Ep9510]
MSIPEGNTFDPCSVPSTLTNLENTSTLRGNSRDPKPKVESNGLYLLLSNTGLRDKYHWGLFVAQTNITGVVYHQALAGLEWKFITETADVTESHHLLLILRIGVIDGVNDEWIQAIKSCVRGVEVEEEFTCRTWLLAAVYQLALEGYIGLQPDWKCVHKIEEEAKRLAQDAFDMGTSIVVDSELNAL